MADDKLPGATTEKPVVVENIIGTAGERSSSGERGGGNTSRQQQSRQASLDDKDNNSSETSVSTLTSSPGGKPKGFSNSKDRRPSNSSNHREGRQRRRGAGGTGKESQGQNKKSTQAVSASEESQAAAAGVDTPQQEASSASTSKKSKSKFAVKKRAPPKEDYEIKPNDVFVNEKSHFKGQLSKCKKLFEKGHQEIFLHGLGKAIPRAINIAFELKTFYRDTVDYTVNTSTIQLFDDVVDLENPDQPPTTRTRNVSSVDIKVFRSVDIP